MVERFFGGGGEIVGEAREEMEVAVVVADAVVALFVVDAPLHVGIALSEVAGDQGEHVEIGGDAREVASVGQRFKAYEGFHAVFFAANAFYPFCPLHDVGVAVVAQDVAPCGAGEDKTNDAQEGIGHVRIGGEKAVEQLQHAAAAELLLKAAEDAAGVFGVGADGFLPGKEFEAVGVAAQMDGV